MEFRQSSSDYSKSSVQLSNNCKYLELVVLPFFFPPPVFVFCFAEWYLNLTVVQYLILAGSGKRLEPRIWLGYCCLVCIGNAIAGLYLWRWWSNSDV